MVFQISSKSHPPFYYLNNMDNLFSNYWEHLLRVPWDVSKDLLQRKKIQQANQATSIHICSRHSESTRFFFISNGFFGAKLVCCLRIMKKQSQNLLACCLDTPLWKVSKRRFLFYSNSCRSAIGQKLWVDL